MDALLTNTQNVVGAYPYWDFQVVNGSVPIIYDAEAELQEAIVCAYTQKGLIKQLPNVGVNWTKALVGTNTILDVDAEIIKNLYDSKLRYKPIYDQNTINLKVTIVPM